MNHGSEPYILIEMFWNVKRVNNKWYQGVNGGGTTCKDEDFALLNYRQLLRTERLHGIHANQDKNSL